MSKIFTLVVAFLITCNLAAAQDLVITNARIIDGNGVTIEQGSVVVRGGRIASVSAGSTDAQGVRVDANGMTVMPGLIDTHRHDLFDQRVENADELAAALEDQTPRNLQTLLAEGFTTIMVPAAYLSASLEIRRQLENQELVGPRLLTVGPAFSAPGDHPGSTVCRGQPFCIVHSTREVSDAATAREMVRELAAEGVDGIKAVYDSMLAPEVRLDDAVLAAIMDEATLLGLPALVHAGTAEELIRVVELGAQKLVHVPDVGLIADGSGASILLEASVPVSTTISYSIFGRNASPVSRSAPCSPHCRPRPNTGNTEYPWQPIRFNSFFVEAA